MTGRLIWCCLFLMSVSWTQANITSLCGTGDSYWEVHEGQRNNTFTCTGLSAQDTVQWYRWVSNDDSTYLGSCPLRPPDGSQAVCDIPFDRIFVPSRISDDTGVMLVNPTALSNTNLIEKGRLTCTVLRQGVIGAAAGCRLDYIHAAENVSCTAQFQQDTWTVSGHCSVKKTRSAHNRYRCEWMQIKESSREAKLIANTSMTVVPSVGTNYVSGSCNLTSDLPPEGRYTYRVTVAPGEVTVDASFIGSNEIRRPTSTPYHNCPQYVVEGGDLRCTCFVTDPGSPPGVLQWNTTQSPQLNIKDIQAWNSGTYVCRLLWNNSLVQSVEYTLRMASPPSVHSSPSVLDFSVNSAGNMTVNTENTRVDFKCVANGRPTPSVRLINGSDPSQFLNQSEPKSDVYDDNESEEVRFSIDRVKCENSGVYRCEANNTLGQDSQSQRLLVYCAPRGKNNDDKVPTVGATEGKGQLSFTMTAYPTPGVKNITYLEGMVNQGRGESLVKDNIIQVACSASYLGPAAVTCNVSVIDMKRTDRGFYRIVFSNSLGEIAFIFYLEEDNQEGGADSKTVAIAVLAAILTVVLVVIVVAVVWVWRRGWRLPCTGEETQRLAHQRDLSGDTSQHHLTTASTEMSRIGKDSDVGPYDGLRLEDVGMRSPYEEI